MKIVSMRYAGTLVAGIMASCTGDIGDPRPIQTPGPELPDSSPSNRIEDAGLTDARDPRATCNIGDGRVLDEGTGHCYMLFLQPTSWSVARLACTELGGNTHLAVSTGLAENQLLSSLAMGRDIWIGGTDADTEGTWEWLNGEAVTYLNWRSGEPNDYGTNGEDCMIIEGENGGLWDDRACTDTYGFICERE